MFYDRWRWRGWIGLKGLGRGEKKREEQGGEKGGGRLMETLEEKMERAKGKGGWGMGDGGGGGVSRVGVGVGEGCRVREGGGREWFNVHNIIEALKSRPMRGAERISFDVNYEQPLVGNERVEEMTQSKL